MLQNVMVTALTVSELLREDQQQMGGKGGIVTQPPGFRLIPAIIGQNFIPIAEL